MVSPARRRLASWRRRSADEVTNTHAPQNVDADVAEGGGDDIPAVLDLHARTAERQVEREASWFRQAGFTMDAPPLDVVLSGPANGVP